MPQQKRPVQHEGPSTTASKAVERNKRQAGTAGRQQTLAQPLKSSRVPATSVRANGCALVSLAALARQAADSIVVSHASRPGFINPYSIAELEFIRTLYTVTTSRHICDRLWSIQIQNDSSHMYLYMATTATMDPTALKNNVGAVVYSQRVVQNEEAGEAFLVHLKPQEPSTGTPTTLFRVFTLAAKNMTLHPASRSG